MPPRHKNAPRSKGKHKAAASGEELDFEEIEDGADTPESDTDEVKSGPQRAHAPLPPKKRLAHDLIYFFYGTGPKPKKSSKSKEEEEEEEKDVRKICKICS